MKFSTSIHHRIQDYSRHPGGLEAVLVREKGEAYQAYRERWQAAGDGVTPFPLYVLIETSDRCNYRCGMCFRSDDRLMARYRYGEELAEDVFRRIARECAAYGPISLCLSSTNEPLLDARLPLLLGGIGSPDLFADVMLTTNAALLSDDIAGAIIAAGIVTRLNVSIDAASARVYRNLRGGDLEKVRRNVLGFLGRRNDSGRRLPLLRVSFCVTSENEHEQAAFLSEWGEVADMVSFQQFVPPADRPQFRALIPNLAPRAAFSCPQPYERLVVRGDGQVYPCCSHVMNTPVGSIHTDSLHSIWHNEKMAWFRKITRTGAWAESPDCARCAFLNDPAIGRL